MYAHRENENSPQANKRHAVSPSRAGKIREQQSRMLRLSGNKSRLFCGVPLVILLQFANEKVLSKALYPMPQKGSSVGGYNYMMTDLG